MTFTLLRAVLVDSLRSRWVIVYTVFFALVTEGLLSFTSGGARVTIGLMNIVLLLLPLGSIIFGTMHIHDSRDFIELVLVQPVKRTAVYHALWLGVVLPFLAAFTLGTAVPMAIHGTLLTPISLVVLLAGNLITMVFFAIAYVIGLAFREKATAMGVDRRIHGLPHGGSDGRHDHGESDRPGPDLHHADLRSGSLAGTDRGGVPAVLRKPARFHRGHSLPAPVDRHTVPHGATHVPPT